MRLNKTTVAIGKTPYTVIQFNYNPPKDNISVNKIHFIQIIDRSGSMAPHIDELIENVKKTINVMDSKDLLSVIWFSGPGEYKVLLRGASPDNPLLVHEFDKLKSTLGTTCFSEAMKEAKEIVDDLAQLSDSFVVSLFTDGEPIVPWSVQEEESRTKDIIAEFKERILSFNTIGYGSHYNAGFLKDLAATSKFGRYVHSNKIGEYLTVFKHNFKAVEKMSSTIIEITCPGKSILYATRITSKLDKDYLKINLLSKSTNNFYLISTNEEDFEFQINGECFNTSNIKYTPTDIKIENLLYTLAYEQYYKGNSSESLDILMETLRDKFFTKLALNSFTAKERKKCEDILFLAAHNRKLKISPKTWSKARLLDGLLEENEVLNNGPCFMDLLKVFEKNGDKFFPIGSKKYKRIGKKVVDNYNAFKKDPTAELIADFRDLVFTKDRLNISIRYTISGFVLINPRQAKAVGFKTNSFNAKIFREQTLIKDGEINIVHFQALICKDTLKYLTSLNIKDLFTVVDKNYSLNDDSTLVNISLTNIPVLNRGYILQSDRLDYILDIYYEQRDAECKQKVTKYFIGKMNKNLTYPDQKYSKEQLELLKEYGFDSTGIYQGIDNKVVKEYTDQYVCKYFEFALKGFSTLPKIDDLLTKMLEGKKKLNGPETIMASYIKYLRENGFETNLEKLNKLLEEQKSIIRTNTRISAQIKLAKTLTGDWWEGLRLDSKDNYLYEKEDKTLIIKVVRKTVQI